MKNAVSSLTTTPHHSTPLYPLRLREARKTQRDHESQATFSSTWKASETEDKEEWRVVI